MTNLIYDLVELLFSFVRPMGRLIRDMGGTTLSGINYCYILSDSFLVGLTCGLFVTIEPLFIN
jgi:hypothetical protein